MSNKKIIMKDLEELSDYLFNEYKKASGDDAPACYDRYCAASNALDLLEKLQEYINELQHAPSYVPSMQQQIVRCEDCKKININDYIKVKLTQHGYELHNEHFKKYLGKNYNEKLFSPIVDTEGFTKYQLWDFMNIFGEYMYNGTEQIIENNLIYFMQTK